MGFASMATAIGFVIDVPQLLRLHLHHAETTGRVIRVIPNSHGLTEIEYLIQGTPYKREVLGYWVPALRTDADALGSTIIQTNHRLPPLYLPMKY